MRRLQLQAYQESILPRRQGLQMQKRKMLLSKQALQRSKTMMQKVHRQEIKHDWESSQRSGAAAGPGRTS